MQYCEKCDTEYECEEECRCRQYRRWCESGQKNRVPREWKLDWGDGYVNDPEDCEHMDFDESMDGSRRCLECGLKVGSGIQ